MCFLFLDPQDEVGPSISSSFVLCSFVLLVYIVVLVLVVCLCPSSVHVVATFSATVLFPLLCSVLFYFIHKGIYVRATCFDLVVHPQALQENRSKSCLVFLYCGIPNAYMLTGAKSKLFSSCN